LTKTDDFDQDYFDESFAYDAQGRIAAQRRYDRADSSNGGEYSYYGGTNKLKSVADNMGGSTSYRTMSANDNFAYDRDGNLVEDKSKQMKIAYDWRGMPVEFARNTDGGDSLKLVMKYDGAGRRISKTLTRKVSGGEWDSVKVTHYTGIGTEVREEFADSASETKVVVNMPQGLGRYGIDRAEYVTESSLAFELYLKNHLGSTMAVYRTTGTTAGPPVLQSAFDYRSFGEKIDLTVPTDKVTENFTGKELDDETLLSNHGARLLDPMLGMWISVDPKRFFSSPYLYMGNGYNPVRFADLNGQAPGDPFGSAEAAAQDFARLYNGVSIATSTEYGTIIYRKGNSFSYVTPSFGTSKSVNLDECVMDVAGNAELQLITSAHAHGSYSSFRNLDPSPLDFQSEFVASDYNLYPYYKENIDAPAYVAVPNGKLIEYRSDGSSKEVPTSGIAADPRSRWSDIDERYHADLELLE
jgi:RHS repeat-associated protein